MKINSRHLKWAELGGVESCNFDDLSISGGTNKTFAIIDFRKFKKDKYDHRMS